MYCGVCIFWLSPPPMHAHISVLIQSTSERKLTLSDLMCEEDNCRGRRRKRTILEHSPGVIGPATMQVFPAKVVTNFIQFLTHLNRRKRQHNFRERIHATKYYLWNIYILTELGTLFIFSPSIWKVDGRLALPLDQRFAVRVCPLLITVALGGAREPATEEMNDALRSPVFGFWQEVKLRKIHIGN